MLMKAFLQCFPNSFATQSVDFSRLMFVPVGHRVELVQILLYMCRTVHHNIPDV